MFSAYSMGNHTLALNMACPCTEMSAWWWLLVTETCSKLHIIEYIVVFWRNDHFGYTTSQRDGSNQIMCYIYSVGFLFTFWTVPQFLRLINCNMLQFSATKTNKIFACVCATLGCIRKIVKSDCLLRFCPSVSKNSAPTGQICMKYDYASWAHHQSLVRLYFRTSSAMSCSLAIHVVQGVAACRQTLQYSEFFFSLSSISLERFAGTLKKGHDVGGCCLRITVTRKIPWQLWVSGGIPQLRFLFLSSSRRSCTRPIPCFL